MQLPAFFMGDEGDNPLEKVDIEIARHMLGNCCHRRHPDVVQRGLVTGKPVDEHPGLKKTFGVPGLDHRLESMRTGCKRLRAVIEDAKI